MISMLKAPGTERLKLTLGYLLSNFAFKFSFRRYTEGAGAPADPHDSTYVRPAQPPPTVAAEPVMVGGDWRSSSSPPSPPLARAPSHADSTFMARDRARLLRGRRAAEARRADERAGVHSLATSLLHRLGFPPHDAITVPHSFIWAVVIAFVGMLWKFVGWKWAVALPLSFLLLKLSVDSGIEGMVSNPA